MNHSTMQVQFLKNKVSSINAPADGQAGSVELVDGERVDYDWLVLALGAETNTGVSPNHQSFKFLNLPGCIEVHSGLDIP
jgi:NADH dehydrogenase FAD-containing subunit